MARVLGVVLLVVFVTVFDIAAHNGILLVSHHRQLPTEGASFHYAVVHGSMERLSPIFMT